jgi:hypothetical protein
MPHAQSHVIFDESMPMLYLIQTLQELGSHGPPGVEHQIVVDSCQARMPTITPLHHYKSSGSSTPKVVVVHDLCKRCAAAVFPNYLVAARRSVCRRRLAIFAYHDQHKCSLRHPTSIEIRARTSDDTETSRGAILSCDPASDSNLVSHHLVAKILHEPIHICDGTSTDLARSRICDEEVGGYVDLDWRVDSDAQRWHTSRFLVTTTYNPPYDAVLGRKDAEHYGMLRYHTRSKQ